MANKVGKAIREAREAKSIDQGSLAVAISRPQSHVSRYESGERPVPTNQIKTIAHHLEIDPLDLLELQLADQISIIIQNFKESKL